MTSEIAPKSQVLLIGQGRYDLETGALTAADGAPIHLRKQSVDVLAVLSSRAGEVVDREALVRAVWKEIATTDDSLIQFIGDIRRALGKDVIETYPKIGYRLVAVAASADRPAERPRIRLRLIAAVGAIMLIVSGLGFCSLLVPADLMLIVQPLFRRASRPTRRSRFCPLSILAAATTCNFSGTASARI